MDFKKLLQQLEDIEKQVDHAKILSEDIKRRLNLKDLDKLKDLTEKQRKEKLAQLAIDNNFPGLFDPVNGRYLDAKDKDYTFLTPSKDAVETLAYLDLIPKAARDNISGWFGRGMNTGEYAQASGRARSVATQVDTALKIMDDALKGLTSTSPTSENYNAGLAKSLTESFGYQYKKLYESITKEQHQELKAIVARLKNYSGNDTDVKAMLDEYEKFVAKRDELVQQIMALVKTINQKSTAAPAAVHESMQLDEGAKDVAQYLWRVAKKAALPIYVVYEIWNAWSETKELKTKHPEYNKEQFKHRVLEIWAKPFVDGGAFWVGTIAGAALGGAVSGPAAEFVAPVTGLIGGFVAIIQGAETINKFVDAVADYFFPQGAFQTVTAANNSGASNQPSQDGSASANANSSSPAASGSENTQVHQRLEFNPNVEKLQTALKNAGVGDLGPYGPKVNGKHTGVDGKLGKYTVGAIQEYKKAKGLPNDMEAIAQLLGVKPSEVQNLVNPTQSESIIYSSMSDAERMAYVRNRLQLIESSKLDEGIKSRLFLELEAFARENIPWLGKVLRNEAEIVNAIGKDGPKLKIPAKVPGQVGNEVNRFAGQWKFNEANGMYENAAAGQRMTPKEMQKALEEANKIKFVANAENDVVRFGAEGHEVNYTYRKGQWVDPAGNPVATTNPSLVKTLNETNKVKKTAEYEARANGQASPSTGNATPNAQPNAAPNAANPAASAAPAANTIAQATNAAGQATVWQRFKNSPVMQSVVAAIATLGYLFNRDGNIFSPNGRQDAPNSAAPNSAAPNSAAPNAGAGNQQQQQQQQQVDPAAEEKKKLTDLVTTYMGAFPDDALPDEVKKIIDSMTGTGNQPSKDQSSDNVSPALRNAMQGNGKVVNGMRQLGPVQE